MGLRQISSKLTRLIPSLKKEKKSNESLKKKNEFFFKPESASLDLKENINPKNETKFQNNDFENYLLNTSTKPEDTNLYWSSLQFYLNKIPQNEDDKNNYTRILNNAFQFVLSNKSKNCLNMLTFLVHKGADVNKPNEIGFTPLMTAAEINNTPAIKILAEVFQADVDLTDAAGNTALLIAVEKESTESVELLLKLNANVNAVDKSKNSPLHIAALYNYHGIVSLLLTTPGIDTAIIDERGETALKIAQDRNYSEIAQSIKLHDNKAYTLPNLN